MHKGIVVNFHTYKHRLKDDPEKNGQVFLNDNSMFKGNFTVILSQLLFNAISSSRTKSAFTSA